MTESSTIFPWPRYWFPAENGDLRDFCQQGYLSLPPEEHHPYYPSVPTQLSELSQAPVLVLLGDPGSGKSHALVDEHKRLLSTDPDNPIVFCDLKEYGAGDQQSLAECLLDREKLSLAGEGRRLWILIDGLDECGLHSPADWLIREFVKRIDFPERVFVRIACRASSWPEILEKALEERWQSTSKSPIGKLRLCPLREEDVRTAARTMGIDADGYLQAVAEREAEELAAHPVTGRFMLDLYQQGKLPKQRTDIFEKGLRLLCEDSPARRKSENRGSVSADVRFMAAARLSISYTLQGCNGIWVGPKVECPKGLFMAHEILGTEKRDKSIYVIDGLAISETLELTGLFTRLDLCRYQFASRTFAEFLAAWYIAASTVPTNQKLKLLLHPEAGRLPPDLHETAAWLAAMDAQLLNWLVEHEPYAALESDLATLAKGDLPALVDGLLKMAAREERPSYDRQRLSKLNYSGLEKQLASVISDRSCPNAMRALACRIANACELGTVSRHLADLALDEHDELDLRELAARILGNLHNDAETSRLSPLAASDQHQSLKAIALAQLGPRLLGGEAFFAQLSPAYIDAAPSELRYAIYEKLFFESLNGDDILEGLKWISAHAPYPIQEFYSTHFKSRLLAKVFSHLDRPGMVVELVKALKSLRRAHNNFFDGLGEDERPTPLDDAGLRHIVLAELLKQIEPDEAFHWLYSQDSCARDEDVTWLLKCLDMGLSEREHRNAAALLSGLIRWNTDREVIDTILDKAGKGVVNPDRILAEHMAWLIEPMDLTNPETETLRKNFLEHQAWEKEHKQRRAARRLPQLPSAYVQERLLACEAGDLKQWPELIFSLTFKEDGSCGFPCTPQELPGWEDADDALRNRLGNVALSYLEQSFPPDDDSLLKNTYTIDERAGGFAFAALAATNKLDQVSHEIWGRWCLAIAVHHFEPSEVGELIFRMARATNSDAFDQAALTVLDKNALEGHTSLLRALIPVWHPALCRLVARRLLDPSWAFSCRLQLAEFMIDRGEDKTIDQARQWLKNEADVANRRSTAQMLLIKAPAEAWGDIQEILAGDLVFAQEVMLGVVHSINYGRDISVRLDAPQLGWLYERLRELFPPEEDPPIPEGPHSPSARQDISRFRDDLIGRLASLGTLDAVKELDRICVDHPGKPWLIRLRADGYKQLWRRERSPVSFFEAIELLADETTTVVRNSRELMLAVEEALKRFAHEAQNGSPPLSVFLWDEHEKKHLSEQRLSDFLKFYLDREWRGRRIVLNREVEIRNLRDFGIGERTDLFVQATLPDDTPGDTNPCVVIEVKCNSNVKGEDIPVQLVGKYLDGETRDCGLYLVGWFGNSKAKLEELRVNIDLIAHNSSTDRLKISSLVLDLSHPLHGKQ